MIRALRNKKTGRLLVLDAATETRYDWGIEGTVEYAGKYLELRDSDYPGTVFVTNQEGVIEDLLKEGKCSYPEIRIDFGWNRTKFEVSDLEAVELYASPPTS